MHAEIIFEAAQARHWEGFQKNLNHCSRVSLGKIKLIFKNAIF